MINRIDIKNFKSLRDVTLRLSSLNILAGLNGSGKSSLIQTLLLLRQSFERKDHNGLLLQGGNLINLGSGKDVFCQDAGRDEYIEFSLEDDRGECLKWAFAYEAGSDILPVVESGKSRDMAGFGLFTANFQYLNTEHIPSTDVYPRSEYAIKNRDIGPKGEFAAHYLAEYGISEHICNTRLCHERARSNSLIHQVDAWIGEISPGVRLIAEDIKSIGQVRLAFKFETHDGYTSEIKPANTGFGISYVLPVVVAVLKARKGDIVIIENPESYLHPKGQSVLGRMIAYGADNGVQFIIETHSDHFINGVRVAIKKDSIPPSTVRIFYFDRVADNTGQHTAIEEIRLDKQGELSVYPKGFLDEWNEQLMQLI